MLNEKRGYYKKVLLIRYLSTDVCRLMNDYNNKLLHSVKLISQFKYPFSLLPHSINQTTHFYITILLVWLRCQLETLETLLPFRARRLLVDLERFWRPKFRHRDRLSIDYLEVTWIFHRQNDALQNRLISRIQICFTASHHGKLHAGVSTTYSLLTSSLQSKIYFGCLWRRLIKKVRPKFLILCLNWVVVHKHWCMVRNVSSNSSEHIIHQSY